MRTDTKKSFDPQVDELFPAHAKNKTKGNNFLSFGVSPTRKCQLPQCFAPQRLLEVLVLINQVLPEGKKENQQKLIEEAKFHTFISCISEIFFRVEIIILIISFFCAPETT